ncbi:unnamed protein product [Mucor hiemalis]
MAISQRFYSAGHEDESFESFTERYVKFFDGVEDLFELQRGLNNAFAYDLFPPLLSLSLLSRPLVVSMISPPVFVSLKVLRIRSRMRSIQAIS